ncbi:MAG: hypothetical protein WA208_06270, partial [Thermoanaerobaculia bacterium]
MTRILAALLALLASPLAATWEAFTSKTPIGPAAYDQTSAVVASNGFDYLAAWTTETPLGGVIATQRVNADGTLDGLLARPLDPVPPVWTVRNARALAMSASRDGYFLSWLSDAGLNIAMTDAFGVPMNRITRPLANVPLRGKTLTAWNGAVHLVLSGYDGPFQATLVANNGSVVAADVPVGNTHGEYTADAVVADTSGFLVLSTKQREVGIGFQTDIYGRRITANGVPGEWFLVRSTAASIFGLEALQDGAQTIVIWSDKFGLWLLRLDASNQATPARQLLSGSGTAPGSLVRHGSALVLSYGDRLLTLDREGQMLRNDPFAGPALASNGSRLLAVGIGKQPVTGDYVSGRFVHGETAQNDFVIARSAALQQNGGLLPGNDRLVAVWDQISTGGRHVLLSLRGANGGFAPPEGIQVSTTGSNLKPAAAFNGTNYLVAWTRITNGNGETVARRIAPDGTPLDANELLLGPADTSSAPRVASDGDGWLVLWTRTSGPSSCAFAQPPPRLRIGRVSSSGTVLEPDGLILSEAFRVQQDADVIWSGTEYVVVWQEHCPPPRPHYPLFTWIQAATISPDLRRIEVHAISPESAPRNVSRSKPRVAAAGDRVLIAWQLGT